MYILLRFHLLRVARFRNWQWLLKISKDEIFATTDHQFLIRSNANKDVLTHFESILEDYFATSKSQHLGLPSVQYFADQLHLSPNYFGDLIKKETSKSAQEHIQTKLIDIAKNKVLDTSKTLNEIADELGFKYPQHFSRFFKEKVGCSPTEYRTIV